MSIGVGGFKVVAYKSRKIDLEQNILTKESNKQNLYCRMYQELILIL
jgi:hypothetical protein